MKTKKKEDRTYSKLVIVSAAMAVLVLVISAIFIYMPFDDKTKSLRIEILKERDKNVLIGKIRAIGKHLKIYNKRIPEQGGVSWLLGEVSNMASKEHIEIPSIKPGNPEDHGLYTKLFVIVDIACTYDQLGRFVAIIESSEKFLKVESLDIKRMDSEEKFEKGSGKFKAFDIKGNIVISTIVSKE